MVKAAVKKDKKSAQGSSESLVIDDDDVIASSSISNTNTDGDDADVSIDGGGAIQEEIQGSGVWKYATKISPEKARLLSRKGQSTSSVRRHLRLVHELKEFEEKTIKSAKRYTMMNSLSPDEKRKLNELALNAIIEDGRSFNDLNKPGIVKLFNGLLSGFRPPHRNTIKRNLKRLNQVHVEKLTKQLNDANFIAITTDFWCDRSSRSYLCMTGHWYDNNMNVKSKILVFAPFHDRHTSDNISSELEQHLKRLNILEKTTTITCDGASNMKASFRKIDSRIKRLQCLAHKLHLIICNALGLWIKNRKKNDDTQSTGSDDEYVLDEELRSLSLNELNNDENVIIQDHDDENPESSEETEDYCYLSIDLWENDVITDSDFSNDLQRSISNIMNKCRSIIKMINKSSNLTSYIDKLKVIHKIPNSLSIDCISRWNSTKFMIGNMLKFKQLIIQLHSDKHDLPITSKRKQKLTNLELTSDEWRMIASIDNVLKPFYEATTLMSGQKYATIGTALFAIRKIKSFLENYVDNNLFATQIKNDLLEQMVKYIDDDTEQLETIIFLAYFDPLGFSMLNQKERTSVERDIKKLVKDYNDDLNNVNINHDNQPNLTQTSSSPSQNNSSKSKSILSSFLSSVSTDASVKRQVHPNSNNNNSIADELFLYKSLATKEVKKIVDNNLNPDASEFWRIFGNQMPQLKNLAKRFLCTPATSVPSESAFSIAS
ncbi:unnamed protein product, partial [Rotaria sp. Silwood2]